MAEQITVTFVDLETSGLNPKKSEIIEAAAIRTIIDDDMIKVIDRCEFKIEPLFPVDPFIANINGYDEDVWEDEAVPFEHAIGEIFKLMRGAWHAGSNPGFDEAFLKKAAKDLNWDYPKLASHHLLDVSMLAFPLLIKGEVESIRQETICKHYGIKGGGHRALADALQCLRLFGVINNLNVIEGQG